MSAKILEAISQTVEEHFNSIALEFLGFIPKIGQQKRITFTSAPNSLISLFFDVLGDKKLNKPEEDTLKSLLIIANGYVEALKEKTKTNTLQQVNSYISDKRSKLQTIKAKEISGMVEESIGKAKSHFNMIVNAESNKTINVGTGLKIGKAAESVGDTEPTVFFIVTQDDVTGPYEYILHLLPDRKTPRLWKLSEVTSNYYKPGDQYPSFSGLHNFCRCRISYLPKGYGFDAAGKIKFIALDHDEFKIQREKYGLPDVPSKISRSKKSLTPT